MPQLRRIGSTDLQTPPLVLGGNVFGDSAKGDTAFAILDRFIDAGGTMIDSADVYSAWVDGHEGGESEALLGEWLRRRGRRDDVLIATKVGMLPGEGGAKLEPARIAAAVDASLKRLGTDYIDLYYAHQDDPATPMEDSLAAFDALVKAGKVRVLGASNFTADRLAEALAISEREGLAAYQVVQPELNLMRRDQYEGPLQTLCVEKGLGVLTYFALASGFLTGKYRSEADLSKGHRAGRVKQYLGDRGTRILKAMDAVVADTGATHAQVALAWVAAQPGVTAPIASATRVEQLEELLAAMEMTLTADQIARLDEASR
ncbi:aldo/keto reductase [Allosphingosinicella indica]|uniref:Predicted oxidoreductase n=1 Tax=Allosphingosinicella indica TaxID=941907 RepID=A0A1X7GFD2_9SPHN|nr:aldo/keto reductase [Allosphingosinicella indica]SMF68915.1 Predicted oxidoreductase [Allosphingosinicella indica]